MPGHHYLSFFGDLLKWFTHSDQLFDGYRWEIYSNSLSSLPTLMKITPFLNLFFNKPETNKTFHRTKFFGPSVGQKKIEIDKPACTGSNEVWLPRTFLRTKRGQPECEGRYRIIIRFFKVRGAHLITSLRYGSSIISALDFIHQQITSYHSLSRNLFSCLLCSVN